MHAELVNEGKRRELDAWEKFEVFLPLHESKVQKQMVDTRWVLTWKEAEVKYGISAKTGLMLNGGESKSSDDGLPSGLL